jgi:uncharacterized repeat protein (TIGR03803 family)
MCSVLVASEYSAEAQTNFMVLKLFAGDVDGAVPACTLVADQSGMLYGTTLAGGVSNAGTVFRINKGGSGFSTLKRFNVSDGANPFAGLLVGSDGALFGTTYNGGASSAGTLFKVNRDGSDFALLHEFLGGTDGANPQNGLIKGSDGMIYGVIPNGNSVAHGAIFRINKDGSGYSQVFVFTDLVVTGVQPGCKLVEGSNGALYGTARVGGATFRGIIFKVNKDGTGYTILYNFQKGIHDGAGPAAGLVKGSDGFLYGAAHLGGTLGVGTVFRIDENGGGYGTLWNFQTNGLSGQFPISELVEGADGALYGTTLQDVDGSSNGTFFKVNKDGSGFVTLRSFSSADGAQPNGTLMQDDKGILYGSVQYGNVNGVGCLVSLSSSPLAPRALSISASISSNFVQFAATSGVQYDVQRSADLASWSVIDTVVSPLAGVLGFPDISPVQPVGFYRLHQH